MAPEIVAAQKPSVVYYAGSFTERHKYPVQSVGMRGVGLM